MTISIREGCRGAVQDLFLFNWLQHHRAAENVRTPTTTNNKGFRMYPSGLG